MATTTTPVQQSKAWGLKSLSGSTPHRTTTTTTPLQPTQHHPLEVGDTASLLRLSRSMIDDLSPASAVSDDDDDDDDDNDNDASVHFDSDNKVSRSRRPRPPPNNKTKPQHSSPKLRSLQRKTIPPIPDEQDRKRFVGCLAAVLACAYDYDDATVVVGGGSENCNDQSSSSSFAEQASRAESRALHDDYDDEREDEGAAPHRHHHSTWGLSDVGPSNSNASFDESLLGPSKSQKAAQVAARHRKRRYDVLSKVLLSSAELLQVDKSQARAFLPMLSNLLLPHQGSTRATQRSTTSRRAMSRASSRSNANDGESAVAAENGTVSAARVPACADSEDLYHAQLDRIEHARPFLESLTPGAGFRCLAMFLVQHLLHSPAGYDARVRHSLKVLAVLLLVHDMESDPVDVLAGEFDEKVGTPSVDRVTIATRKFEALEHCIATKLLHLSKQQAKQQTASSGGRPMQSSSSSSRRPNPSSSTALVRQSSSGGVTREQLLRGLKIGGTAVIAGTLFAVTGGLAAPGIAAGVAALAGGGAAVTAAATAVFTSTAAVTAIFGVGGGSLAAYKMQRRTQGLTSFEFHKESGDDCVDLFLTVAISGWLRDECDFQRPWGVLPSNPSIQDRLELLERFYAVHSPDHVSKCKKILQSWQGEEEQLWRLLRDKYGRDPSSLFPLAGPRQRYGLTLEQKETIDLLFVELGYVVKPTSAESIHEQHQQLPTPLGRVRMSWKMRHNELQPSGPLSIGNSSGLQLGKDSLHGPHSLEKDTSFGASMSGADSVSSFSSSGIDRASSAMSSTNGSRDEGNEKSTIPKHISTVWDYSSYYGGELYTVKWEADLMTELCDSVSDLAFELVSGGTAQLLKHTALSTIMSAIAWPYALVNAANLIDGTWTLAVERSDAAGRELARSLLFSRAGHRPVTLVGFSFGARAIYACLKELARFQQKWENYQEGQIPEDDEDMDDWKFMYKTMREPASIVEDAILMGLPNHLSSHSWTTCRQVVAGRLVNCYSQKDLVLSLMFQFKRLGLKPVCGTCAVNVSGVENIDVTDIVAGHQDYCLITGEILKRVRHGEPFHILPSPQTS